VFLLRKNNGLIVSSRSSIQSDNYWLNTTSNGEIYKNSRGQSVFSVRISYWDGGEEKEKRYTVDVGELESMCRDDVNQCYACEILSRVGVLKQEKCEL
jgi:hypothetical protein